MPVALSDMATKETPPFYARDYPPFQQVLPHSIMLEDNIVLLITPLRPHWLIPATGLHCALGAMWQVTPVNIEVRSETDCLYLAERLEGLFQMLPEGSAVQVLMSVAPATSAPVWEAARAGSDAAHVTWQRLAIASGLPHYEGTTLAGRLRAFQVYVTVRMPLPMLRTPLLHTLRTIVDPTAAAVESMTSRLRYLFSQQCAEFTRVCAGVEQALLLAGLDPLRLHAPSMLASLARSLTPQYTDGSVWDPSLPLGAQALLEPLQTVPGGVCNEHLRAHVLSL